METKKIKSFNELKNVYFGIFQLTDNELNLHNSQWQIKYDDEKFLMSWLTGKIIFEDFSGRRRRILNEIFKIPKWQFQYDEKKHEVFRLTRKFILRIFLGLWLGICDENLCVVLPQKVSSEPSGQSFSPLQKSPLSIQLVSPQANEPSWQSGSSVCISGLAFFSLDLTLQLFTAPFQSHVCFSMSKCKPAGHLIACIPELVHWITSRQFSPVPPVCRRNHSPADFSWHNSNSRSSFFLSSTDWRFSRVNAPSENSIRFSCSRSFFFWLLSLSFLMFLRSRDVLL